MNINLMYLKLLIEQQNYLNLILLNIVLQQDIEIHVKTKYRGFEIEGEFTVGISNKEVFEQYNNEITKDIRKIFAKLGFNYSDNIWWDYKFDEHDDAVFTIESNLALELLEILKLYQ